MTSLRSIWRIFRCSFFLLFLIACKDKKKVSFSETLSTLSKEQPSPAFDPSQLNPEEQEIFAAMPASLQRAFAALTPKQRTWAVMLTHKQNPERALWMAAKQLVLQQPLDQQKLYEKLSWEMKRRFLALDQEPSSQAVQLAHRLDADQAVDEATKLEMEPYPDEQKKFLATLSPDHQTLFLSLSEQSQIKMMQVATKERPDEAVEEMAEEELKRLPKEEQNFISSFPKEQKHLFLILTPEGRILAMQLTKKLDLNLAVQYAASIQPEEGHEKT